MFLPFFFSLSPHLPHLFGLLCRFLKIQTSLALLPFTDKKELRLTVLPPDDNIRPLLPTLLPPLTAILKSTTQDPTPVLSLTIKLLRPLSFTHLLTIADPPSLLSALRSPLPGANLLALSILHKAASTPADAAILSTLPELVEQTVRVWLEVSDVGVGEKAGRVLGDLLETDCEVLPGRGANGVSVDNGNSVNVNGLEVVRRRLPGHAVLWKLLFADRHLSGLVPALCSPSPSRTSRQLTIAQGRLLRLITRLSTLDLRPITQTPHADLFVLPSPLLSQQVGQGLLQWAALAMVDKSDVLMHLSLIDFFETFVSVMRVSERTSERDGTVKTLVRTACLDDPELQDALRGLPDRTVEDEAEALRKYISEMLGQRGHVGGSS